MLSPSLPAILPFKVEAHFVPEEVLVFQKLLKFRFDEDDKKQNLKENNPGMRYIIDQLDDLDKEDASLLGPIRKEVF